MNLLQEFEQWLKTWENNTDNIDFLFVLEAGQRKLEGLKKKYKNVR